MATLNVLELREQLRDDEIAALVHAFYRRVQQDPLLGPVFDARIPADAWPAHLDTMTRFWSTILRGTGTYLGNPMIAHARLGALGVGDTHFARWLQLFGEVARELLAAPVATSILSRAERMGVQLRAVVAT